MHAYHAVAVAGLLLARTSLDVVMLNLTTTIERAIVARNKSGFKGGMSRFARLCVPVAVVNSVSGASKQGDEKPVSRGHDNGRRCLLMRQSGKKKRRNRGRSCLKIHPSRSRLE